MQLKMEIFVTRCMQSLKVARKVFFFCRAQSWNLHARQLPRMRYCRSCRVQVSRNLKLSTSILPHPLGIVSLFFFFFLTSLYRKCVLRNFYKILSTEKKIAKEFHFFFPLKFMTDFFLSWLSRRTQRSKTVCKI